MSETTTEQTPATDTGQTPEPSRQQPAQQQSEPASQRGPQPQPQEQRDSSAWDGKVESLPDPVQKMIRDLRAEAGNNRTAKNAAEQQQQQLLDGIAQALGLKKDETPPDPQVLQQTLTEREQRIGSLEAQSRSKDVEIAAWRSASRQGANAAALLDSRSFVADVSKLDPTADDFTTQLDAAVKKAMDTNSALRAAPSAGQAGIGVSGTSSDAPTTPGMGTLRQAYTSR